MFPSISYLHLEVNGARVQRAQRSGGNHVVAAVHAHDFLAGPGLRTEGLEEGAHPSVHDLVGVYEQFLQFGDAAAEHAVRERAGALLIVHIFLINVTQRKEKK